MAILRPDEQGHVAQALFGTTGLQAEPGEGAQPWLPPGSQPAPQEVTPAPAAEPEPAAAPVEPPPPPIFEVPEPLVEALYQDVFHRGLEEGRAQGYAELEVLRARYGAALAHLEGLSDALVERNRISIITLACKVAEQVLRAQLRLSPADLIAQVQTVIAELEPVEEVVIHAAPDDAHHLVEARPALAEGAGGGFTLQVIEDPRLEPGDFQVETRGLTADARIEHRLAALEASMLRASQASEEG